ncbi:MAG TPA: hypothetical protein VJW51_07915 [Candidatus Acidoferrales bacterium]|nr:hypothetical protein [Candidatus Acidoferrales bacterium]
MSAVLFAFLAVLSANGLLGSTETPTRITFDHLCGKLVSNTIQKPVRHGVLELHPFREGDSCCGRTAPAARTRTSHWGNFKFKKVPAGDYWLFVQVNGRDFKMAVHYQPMKYPEYSCSLFTFFAQDSGSFVVDQAVLVD